MSILVKTLYIQDKALGTIRHVEKKVVILCLNASVLNIMIIILLIK